MTEIVDYPAFRILQQALETNADLILVGPYRPARMSRFLLETLFHTVVIAARWPVLVVGVMGHSDPERRTGCCPGGHSQRTQFK